MALWLSSFGAIGTGDASCLLCEYGERTAAAADPPELPLAVRCYAEGPVVEGQPLVWVAEVSGGSGSFSYEWSHRTALGGSSVPFLPFGKDQPTVAESYDFGARLAKLRVTDSMTNGSATSEACYMHVLPRRDGPPHSAAPMVTPIVWLPRGVVLDAESIAEIERGWRGIRAGFWHQYGRTFRMTPLQLLSSAFSEFDICGHPDCARIRETGKVVGRANTDADSLIAPFLGYTSARATLAWGAGAHAGSYGWDIPTATVGDVATAAVAGVLTPPIEPNLHDGVARRVLGDYIGGLAGAIAHELNHAIGWDDPHDYNLFRPVTATERAITLAGPFLTEALGDPVPPEGRITAPVAGAVLSGVVNVRVEASDSSGIDAVVVLVDNQLIGSDTVPPFEIAFDTTAVGFGRHVIQAVVYDLAGNITRDSVQVTVRNLVPEPECGQVQSTGHFRACIFAGTGLEPAAYLETLLDAPFPAAATNALHLVNHSWLTGEEIAAGRSTQVSGVWTGLVDLPPDQYVLKVESTHGVRVFVGGGLVADFWTAANHRDIRIPVDLAGPTPFRIEWFHTTGAARLQVFVQPFTFEPPFFQEPTLELHSSPVLPDGPALNIDPGDEVTFEFDSKVDGNAHPPALVAQDRLRGPLPVRLARRGIPDGKQRWTVTWQPDLRDQGQTFEIDFRLADYFGHTVEVGTFSVRVRITELAAFESLPERYEVDEGRLMRLRVQAVNLDGAPIAYTAQGLPGGSVFRPRGDANLDGQVNAADLNAIALLNGTPVTAPHLVPADVNGDGIIDGMDRDLTLILLFQRVTYELAWMPGHMDATGVPIDVQLSATDPRGTAHRSLAIDVRNMPVLFDVPSVAGMVGEPSSFIVRAQDDVEEVVAFAQVVGEPLSVAPYFGPMGDVTLDGSITLDDVTLADLFASGSAVPSDLQLRIADINGNGAIDIEDVWSILFFAFGLDQPSFLFYVVPGEADAGSHEVVITAQNRLTRGVVYRSTRMIVLSEPVVYGRVVTPGGTPVPGAAVELRTIEPNGQGLKQAQITGSDGGFAFTNSQAANALRLGARLRGYRIEPRYSGIPLGLPDPVDFSASERISGTGIPTAGTNTVAGSVTLRDDSPAAAAVVQLRGLHGLRVIVRMATGSRGEYALSGLPDGQYTLTVRRRGNRFPYRKILLSGGEVRIADVTATR